MTNKKIVIAIDGPVGVGKGTLAVVLAKQLGAEYLYTGSMYRALTLACLKNNIDIYSENEVFNLLKKVSIEIKLTDLETRVFLEGKEISDEIFSQEIANKVPTVAAFPSVRKEMVLRQKQMAKNKSIVIEGRDSATDVAPNADLKIYLTADVAVRAKRRLKQLQKRGLNIRLEDVLRQVQQRDKTDMGRKASPLRITSDAFVIDTTHLTVEETVKKVAEKLREKKLI